jgi:hypothetical protein
VGAKINEVAALPDLLEDGPWLAWLAEVNRVPLLISGANGFYFHAVIGNFYHRGFSRMGPAPKPNLLTDAVGAHGSSSIMKAAP